MYQNQGNFINFRIEINDDGKGISEGTQKQMYQGITPMSFCSKMMKQLGGNLELESSKNVGTKATLDFLAHFIPAHQDNQIFATQVLKHN